MATEPREEGAPSLPPPLLWIVVLVGLTAALIPPLIGLLILSRFFGGDYGVQVQQGIGLVGLGVGLAAISAGLGWRLAKNLPSTPFFPRRTWPLWLLFLIIVAGGGFLLPASPLVLGALGTLAMLLLPTLVLGSMGRVMGGRGGTWTDVLGGLIAGSALSAGVAAAIESGLAVGGLFLYIGYTSLSGRSFDLRALIEWLQWLGRKLADPRTVAFLMKPPVFLTILFVFAVLIPAVEEMAKALGVGLLGRWLRPHPARAFLLGIASGAGFALVENVLNVSLFEASFWLGAIVSRVMATVMHCATGGLTGWGWGELWSARRPARLALAYLGAVGIHGMWNGGVVITVLGALALTGIESIAVAFIVSVLVVVSILGIIVVVTACLLGMVGAGRFLARRTA